MYYKWPTNILHQLQYTNLNFNWSIDSANQLHHSLTPKRYKEQKALLYISTNNTNWFWTIPIHQYGALTNYPRVFCPSDMFGVMFYPCYVSSNGTLFLCYVVGCGFFMLCLSTLLLYEVFQTSVGEMFVHANFMFCDKSDMWTNCLSRYFAWWTCW